jgi:outer membrane phospholipase A
MMTATCQNRSRWFFPFLFIMAACITQAFAQETTSVFVAPASPVVAGTASSLWVYSMNNSSNTIQRTFEPRLNAKLILPSVTRNVVLNLVSGGEGHEVTIAPGAFAKQEYLLNIPATLHGQVSLSISNYNEIALQIGQGSVAPETETTPVAPPATPLAPANPHNRSALARFFDNHLSPYEPIYFLVGNYPAAEFQISLKYQLFDLTNYPVVTNLYFGYTQTAYWDLLTSDPSFFDTSYKPSVFAYFPDLFASQNKTFQFDLQGGAEHESNGRGGEMERSIYTAYLQPTLTFGRPGHLQFALQPRAWTYFFVGHNNSDIAQYRGYADLRAFLTLKKDPNSWANFQVETRFRIGDTGEHPGVQVDARYKFPHFNPTLDVQYFEGYGQNLRQYNREAHGLRVGLCLWYWPDYPPPPATK